MCFKKQTTFFLSLVSCLRGAAFWSDYTMQPSLFCAHDAMSSSSSTTSRTISGGHPIVCAFHTRFRSVAFFSHVILLIYNAGFVLILQCMRAAEEACGVCVYFEDKSCFCRFTQMTIHSLYIFSKRGTCLYYGEWNRPRSTLAEMPDEDRKLMFGLVFSLKQLMNKMNPNP